MYGNVIINQVPVMTSVGLYAYAYFCYWPTLNKVENIISTKNVNAINCLAKFIYFANKSVIKSYLH